MNNEDKELRTRAKKKGACRVYLNRFTRNIYYIDLIDFSSKQNRWIQDQFKASNTVNFNKNRGYKYVLVCIDGYSRYLMTRLLKSKDAKTVCSAMQDIIKYYGAPQHINCDQGTEFVNAIFKKNVLEKYNIKMYHIHSDNKSVFAERAIRTIKENIITPFNRSKGIWYEYIDQAVKKHNDHVNSETGYSPNDIWKNNIVYVERDKPDELSSKDTTPQFTVGDYVRVVRKPSVLQKSSLTFKWSETLYEVTDIDTSMMPVMYTVKNTDSGSEAVRKYYHWELLKSKCKPTVKSIVQTRTQSEKNPDKLREAARSHRPVTRSVAKTRQAARKRSK